MDNKNIIKLAERKRLIDDFIIIAGVSRAGKFLLGNLVSSLSNIEPSKEMYLFDILFPMLKLGIIDENTAKIILQGGLDWHSYNTIVGREFNLRFDDKSSIFKSAKLNCYIKRCFNEDRKQLLNDFQKNNRLPSIIAHELCNLDTCLRIFPRVKIIHINRNPIDIVYSWYKRGWGHRFGKDPTAFMFTLKTNNSQVPWFAYKWQQDYKNMSEIDRIIKGLESIIEMENLAINKLNPKEKKRVLFVKFEKILSKTKSELEKIAKFTNSELIEDLPIILAQEKCPKTLNPKDRKLKLIEIKKLASNEQIKTLLKLEKNYNKNT